MTFYFIGYEIAPQYNELFYHQETLLKKNTMKIQYKIFYKILRVENLKNK